MIGHVQYGTVKLEMTYCDLERRPIRSSDDTTFHFLEYVFDVQCVYNPAATSFGRVQNRIPQEDNISFPGTTDVALREYLSQPRRTLSIFHGDRTGAFVPFLVSPPQGNHGKAQPTDAKGGPFCDVISIREHHGTKTWIMHLRFRTYVACQDAKTPVLSHRFRKTVDIDQDYKTLVITSGEVTFDVGRLWAAGLSPDYWRSTFFVAPPDRFKRAHINVEVSDDNSNCRYTIVDQSQAFNLGLTSPATRLEAHLTTGYSQGSFSNALAQYTREAIGITGNVGLNTTLDPAHDAGLIIWAANATALAVTAAHNANVPRYYATMTCRAWGSETSARRDLLNLCIGLMTAKLGTPDFFTTSNTTEINVSQELTGKYVEATMTLRWTDEILVRLANTVVNQARFQGPMSARLGSNGASFYGSYFPLDENVNAIPEGITNLPTGASGLGVLTQLPSTGNRPPLAGAGAAAAIPPNGGPLPLLGIPDLYARGPRYLEKLVAGALSGQCENPPDVGKADGSVTA